MMARTCAVNQCPKQKGQRYKNRAHTHRDKRPEEKER